MTGIALAGGRSSRFGSDKLASIHRGIPLLHHAVLRLGELSKEVVVVAAFAGSEPSLPVGVNARIVRDAHQSEGPLEGLVAALDATSTDLALVVGGDMPDLSVAVLREMLRVAKELPADAVALQDVDRFRPLPAVVRVKPARDVARELLRGGERSLRALLCALDVTVMDEPTWTALDPTRGTFHDVDERSDLSP